MESTKRVQGDTPRFVDKLPQNYFYLPMILKALPNAKIVHLTRDPMDACFASYKQLFADAYASVALFEWVEVGLALPVGLAEDTVILFCGDNGTSGSGGYRYSQGHHCGQV